MLMFSLLALPIAKVDTFINTHFTIHSFSYSSTLSKDDVFKKALASEIKEYCYTKIKYRFDKLKIDIIDGKKKTLLLC